METPALITPAYRDLNAAHHARNESYGSGGARDYRNVADLAKKTGCKSILDYGCGKGGLGKCLLASGFEVEFYDPAFTNTSADPKPCDFVAARDVLEHVEPECLDAVLEHIRSKTLKVFWARIPHSESSDILPDGRNAHLTVEDERWWKRKIAAYFKVESLRTTTYETEYICRTLSPCSSATTPEKTMPIKCASGP